MNYSALVSRVFGRTPVRVTLAGLTETDSAPAFAVESTRAALLEMGDEPVAVAELPGGQFSVIGDRHAMMIGDGVTEVAKLSEEDQDPTPEVAELHPAMALATRKFVKANRGKLRFRGFKTGQSVKWNGESWIVVDSRLRGTNTMTLVLVSHDYTKMANGVPPDALGSETTETFQIGDRVVVDLTPKHAISAGVEGVFHGKCGKIVHVKPNGTPAAEGAPIPSPMYRVEFDEPVLVPGLAQSAEEETRHAAALFPSLLLRHEAKEAELEPQRFDNLQDFVAACRRSPSLTVGAFSKLYLGEFGTIEEAKRDGHGRWFVFTHDVLAEGIEFFDRYTALGIPRPDPATMCKGPCEGTGLVPVQRPRDGDLFVAPDPDAKMEEELMRRWEEAESKNPSDDGWHFVTCPTCEGSRLGEAAKNRKPLGDDARVDDRVIVIGKVAGEGKRGTIVFMPSRGFAVVEFKPGQQASYHTSNLALIRRDESVVEDEGHWRTTKSGHKIYIDGAGKVTKGNPHVLKASSSDDDYGKPKQPVLNPSHGGPPDHSHRKPSGGVPDGWIAANGMKEHPVPKKGKPIGWSATPDGPKVIGYASKGKQVFALVQVPGSTKIGLLTAGKVKESLDEASVNHRDFAAAGLVHKSFVKGLKVGQEVDFYEPGTGDKLYGRVVAVGPSEVAFQVPDADGRWVKSGKIHRLRVSDKLPESIDEMRMEAGFGYKGHTVMVMRDKTNFSFVVDGEEIEDAFTSRMSAMKAARAHVDSMELATAESVIETKASEQWALWADWTPDERIVFSATAELKAGYGGVKDFRFQQASKTTGITRDRWDAAMAKLKQRGTFNAAGAVKPDVKKRYYAERKSMHPSVSQMTRDPSAWESLDEAKPLPKSTYTGKPWDEVVDAGSGHHVIKVWRGQRTKWWYAVSTPQGGSFSTSTEAQSLRPLIQKLFRDIHPPIAKAWVVVGERNPDGDPYQVATAFWLHKADAQESVDESVPGLAQWHQSEGGTGAAPGKKGYSWRTEHGFYHVTPISRGGRHVGYMLDFANSPSSGGKYLGRGLHVQLGTFRSPAEAVKTARQHSDSIEGQDGVVREGRSDTQRFDTQEDAEKQAIEWAKMFGQKGPLHRGIYGVVANKGDAGGFFVLGWTGLRVARKSDVLFVVSRDERFRGAKATAFLKDWFAESVEESGEPLFSVETAGSLIELLREKINAPHLSVDLSTLGGPERAAVMMTLSLDPKEGWQNNILQNSRYMHFSIRRDGKVEQFGRSHKVPVKFRTVTVKSPGALIDKVNAYLKTASGAAESIDEASFAKAPTRKALAAGYEANPALGTAPMNERCKSCYYGEWAGGSSPVKCTMFRFLAAQSGWCREWERSGSPHGKEVESVDEAKSTAGQLFLKLRTTAIKKTEHLPNTAPVVTQVLQMIDVVRDALKGHESKSGDEGVRVFLRAVRKAGFMSSFGPPLTTLARQKGYQVDPLRGTVFMPDENPRTDEMAKLSAGGRAAFLRASKETHTPDSDLTSWERKTKAWMTDGKTLTKLDVQFVPSMGMPGRKHSYGWKVAGRMKPELLKDHAALTVALTKARDALMQKGWEIEEFNPPGK